MTRRTPVADATLADPRDALADLALRTLPCPTCHAAPTVACVTVAGGRAGRRCRTHTARITPLKTAWALGMRDGVHDGLHAAADALHAARVRDPRADPATPVLRIAGVETWLRARATRIARPTQTGVTGHA